MKKNLVKKLIIIYHDALVQEYNEIFIAEMQTSVWGILPKIYLSLDKVQMRFMTSVELST